MTTAPPRTPRRELYLALAEARMYGLRQWQVAAAAGIDPTTLSRIVTRERDPRQAQASALAEVLGVPLVDLFPDLEDDEPGVESGLVGSSAGAGSGDDGS
jgi:transcriptional regulator with XRE-family HTH domain